MPIVAAVDRSDRARSVVEQASELADLYGVELHVVHVGQLLTASGEHLGMDVGVDVGAQPATDVDESRAEAAEVATAAAEGVVDPEEYTPVGRVGDAAVELVKYSGEHDAEYIVTSARKRSPWGQALFGSVTQSLLLNANCPVVAAIRDEE